MTVLGIDMTRRCKAKRETDLDTGKRTWVDRFDIGVVDISGEHGLLAQVDSRDVTTAVDWLRFHSATVDRGSASIVVCSQTGERLAFHTSRQQPCVGRPTVGVEPGHEPSGVARLLQPLDRLLCFTVW